MNLIAQGEVTSDDWTLFKEIEKFLGIFSLASTDTQGEYTTFSKVLPYYRILLDTCKRTKEAEAEANDSDDQSPLYAAADVAEAKLTAYYDVHSGAACIAACLDPRFKFFHFEQRWDGSEARSADGLVTYKDEALGYLRTEYATRKSNADILKQQKNRTKGSEKEKPNSHPLWRHIKQKPREKDEVEEYIALPLAGHEEDPLEWWKMHERVLPILADLAKQVLAIQATTRASETQFSFSGNLITYNRTNLGGDSVESNMCSRSWMSNDLIEKAAKLQKEKDL